MPSGIAKGGTYRLWLPSESARYHCEAVVYKCALRILRDLIQSTCSSKFSYIFPCIRCIQCIPNNLLHFIVCIMFSILNILFQYRTSLNQSLRSKLSCPVFSCARTSFLRFFNCSISLWISSDVLFAIIKSSYSACLSLSLKYPVSSHTFLSGQK